MNTEHTNTFDLLPNNIPQVYLSAMHKVVFEIYLKEVQNIAYNAHKHMNAAQFQKELKAAIVQYNNANASIPAY